MGGVERWGLTLAIRNGKKWSGGWMMGEGLIVVRLEGSTAGMISRKSKPGGYFYNEKGLK